jgi:hypothetical protein
MLERIGEDILSMIKVLKKEEIEIQEEIPEQTSSSGEKTPCKWNSSNEAEIGDKNYLKLSATAIAQR